MADCTRANIPDELYEEHDNGCMLDYLPQRDAEGNAPDLRGVLNPNLSTDLTGWGALYESTGGSFIMRPQQFDDDIMSWASDSLVIPDAPIQGPFYQNYRFINPECDGIVSTLNGYIPQDCQSIISVQTNVYNGLSHNIGLYGATIRFMFTIYKIYCCVYDENEEVTSFSYQFYYTMTVWTDKFGFDSWVGERPLWLRNGFCENILVNGGGFGARQIWSVEL